MPLNMQEDRFRIVALALLQESGGKATLRGFNPIPMDGDVYLQAYANSIDVDAFLLTKDQAERLKHEMEVLAPQAYGWVMDVVNRWSSDNPEMSTPNMRAPWFTGFKYKFGEPWMGQILCLPKGWDKTKVVFSTVYVTGDRLDDPSFVVRAAEDCLEKIRSIVTTGGYGSSPGNRPEPHASA